MKKTLQTAGALVVACLVTLPVAAKVTYADIVAADKPKRDADLAAYYAHKAQDKALKATINPEGGNQIGHWTKISSSVTQWASAGAYAQVLAPNATGQECVKGAKALISNQHTGRECMSYNSHGTMCTAYKTTVITPTDSGYKAECR
ncbi:hypothetical protein A152_0016475 [Vibrio tasmaniensis 1F-187]|uniref:hypothetical protein n=1 Tax=unclassified Vibrio TaxID=2614977 RepID=UPI0002F93A44|nr:hypothetical protein [Vibrio tasmaniensis]OEF70096.1 hypothetical protein A152_02105 [Vibrio tasmaniensis 1F-187]